MRMEVSSGFTPAALTRTRACPAAGCGGNLFKLQHFGGDELADKNGFHGSPVRSALEPYGLSRAVTEISALKSFETGQPVSAALTAASNLARSAPGMCATRSR